MMEFLITLLVLSAIYLGVSGLIAGFIAMPSRTCIDRTPASFGIKYEEVSFLSREDKVLLRGWYIPGGDKGTVIVVHGGKDNRADLKIMLLELCVDLAKRGFNVLSFDRRGCGVSGFAPLRVRSCFERDVAGAFDYVRCRVGVREDISILGISLGAVASIIFASHEKDVSRLVCDSCFADTVKMAKQVLAKVSPVLIVFLPGMKVMGRLIYCFSPVNVIDKIKVVSCPILFIHNEKDDSISIEDAYQLFGSSGNPLNELWVVPNSGHSMAYSLNREAYIERVTGFLLNKEVK